MWIYLIASDFVIVDVRITTNVFIYPSENAIMIILFNKVIIYERFSTNDLDTIVIEPNFIVDNVCLVGNAHLHSTSMVALYSVVSYHCLSTLSHYMYSYFPIE